MQKVETWELVVQIMKLISALEDGNKSKEEIEKLTDEARDLLDPVWYYQLSDEDKKKMKAVFGAESTSVAKSGKKRS